MLKYILAKPGRNGGWAKKLGDLGIPASTADLYVKQYRKRTEPTSVNGPTCAIPAVELTEDEMQKEAQKVINRVSGRIRSPESIEYFLNALKLGLSAVLGEKQNAV